MRTDLVVSHYVADLAWIAPLRRPGVNIIVYEKGNTPCGWPVIRLPNVGKNDHTYLHHIVERYGDLADWTLFTPDYPFDHLHGFAMEQGLTPRDAVSTPRLCTVRDWDASGRIRWDLMKNVPDRNGTNWAERYGSGKITPCDLSFVDWSKKFVGFDPNDAAWTGFAPGGIIGVPKLAILQLPLIFYARLREELSGSVEPECGHYMERLWICNLSRKAKYNPC
jgi:hypothetical protein